MEQLEGYQGTNMTKKRTELKQEMLEMAEARIEELLDWNEGNERPTLSQIEEQVLKWRQKVSEGVTEQLIGNQEAIKPEGGVLCPGCGQKMEYKDAKRKQITSWVGELTLERAYYYCSSCKKGLFPPG